jgi:hypothetical protein
VDRWLSAARDTIAAATGVPAAELELSAEQERLLLEAARVAAHESEQRTNAPLLCYLIGLAAGKSGASLDAVAAAVRESPRG